MLFLLILLLALGLLLRLDFVFYIVYVCAGVYGLSRWLVWNGARSLVANRRYTDHFFVGEVEKVTLELQNTSFWPVPWLQFEDSLPIRLRGSKHQAVVTTLSGRETREYTYLVKGMRRGYYRIGPTRIALGDYFGFASRRSEIPATFVTIYPHIVPLSELGLPARLPFGTMPSRQRIFEDPSRPNGVRPYMSGDSPRQINWKVSAHASQLLTKTLQPAISQETMLLLNFNIGDFSRRGRYEATEWAITTAASIAAYLSGKQQAVGLMTNGADPLRTGKAGEQTFASGSGRLSIWQDTETIGPEDGESLRAGEARALMPAAIPPRSGKANLMKLLELLARLEAADTLDFAAWIPSRTAGLSWGITLLTISPACSPSLTTSLHRLARSGYNPVLILIEATPDLPAIRERGRRLGFTVFSISHPEDLGQWRTRPQFQTT